VPVLCVVIAGVATARVDGKSTVVHRGSALVLPRGVAAQLDVVKKRAEWLVISLPADLDVPLRVERTARSWAISLANELERRETGWELAAEGLILMGLAHARRRAALDERHLAWLDEVTQLARQQNTLVEIAAAVERHPSHVAREFRRYHGVSIGEFARRCRLEVAAVGLRDGEESIADIASDAGFCDQSHFTRAFRRVFGVTPAVYRKNPSRL
jgi:AraC-like DNA-binding protein